MTDTTAAGHSDRQQAQMQRQQLPGAELVDGRSRRAPVGAMLAAHLLRLPPAGSLGGSLSTLVRKATAARQAQATEPTITTGIPLRVATVRRARTSVPPASP